MERRADVLFQKYLADKQEEDLKRALVLYEESLSLLEKMRKETFRPESKQFIQEVYASFLKEAMNICLELHKQTSPQDVLYLEKAFQYSEKNKANLLSEILQQGQAKSVVGVPQ